MADALGSPLLLPSGPAGAGAGVPLLQQKPRLAALRELRRDLMAGLGWERLAAAETKKILDDYPNRVGAI